MSKRERWQLTFVAVIVVVALFSVFPIQGRVRLGLDLKGGVHLLLQAVGTAEV
ncbi:MAG TPA: protein translocase subunit SecD, partial [Synergistaceae bacterium]|nr:protein translocase subunit SecD [Synergistaceae bacterium]